MKSPPEIGAGGMGEVYRARDTKLKREVAIKILPEAFAHDAERVARFQREAQVLAALNHPNIGGIYGLEEANGIHALVLELVEGPTLADVIADPALGSGLSALVLPQRDSVKGPQPTAKSPKPASGLPVTDALTIARQIAEALEAAHEQGIMHRDLKPANIKVRDDGIVKVLDFGLARLATPETSGVGAGAMSQSPTLTTPAATLAGVILGTAAYMSPEQAKGRAADKRSDVWAFGVVLYEMLTGRRPFEGEDLADTLAAVLKSEPDWNALPADVPPHVRVLVQRCLVKDRRQRVADISTALFVMSEASSLAPATVGEGRKTATVARPPLWRRVIPMAAAVGIAALLAGAGIWLLTRPESPSVVRTTITTSGSAALTPTGNDRDLAITPDGSRVVYRGNNQLLVRALNQLEPDVLSGLGAPRGVFISPDGQWVGFFDGTTIKKVAITGGPPVMITPVEGAGPRGATWGRDGTIVYATSVPATGLHRVSAAGGEPSVLTKPDRERGEDDHFWPEFLPGGEAVLFTIIPVGRSVENAQIAVLDLRNGTSKVLIRGGSHAHYVPTGHLVYGVAGTLRAVAFDLRRLEVVGTPAPVLEGVVTTGTGAADIAVAANGSLVYVPGRAAPSATESGLALIDRKGIAAPLQVPPGVYESPRVSPDGARLAFGTSDGKEAVVSTYELSGASAVRRITFGGNNRFPIWSADGRRVAFQSDREGDPAVFWQPADGGTAERLTTPDRGTSHTPESWSPDGEVLLFSATKDFVSSLWTFSLKDRKATPFGDVQGSSLPTNAMFSPDGRWVAYQMGGDRATEGTTYVQPFPPTGTKYQIAGGGRPLWTRDGKELFFVPAPGRLLVVAVRTAPSFTFTSPVEVPRGFAGAAPEIPRTFDIMPDGRIVGVPGQTQYGSGPAQIQVVLNWTEELKRLVPSR